MKGQIAALEVHALVKELQKFVGGRIDNIYHPKKNEVLLQIRLDSGDKQIIVASTPNYLLPTQEKDEMPQKISGFASSLRKFLDNSRILAIKQLNFERIVEISLEKKERFTLIIELFNKGNIILCDSSNKIISCLMPHCFRDRAVVPGEQYTLPPSGYNMLLIDEDCLKTILSNSTKYSVVKSLAIELGLGGLYAEEVCEIADVDKNKKSLLEPELKAIFKAIKVLREMPINAGIIDNKEAVPFPLKSQKGSFVPKESFSSAIAAIIAIGRETPADERMIKLKKIIEEQEKHIALLKESEQNEKMKAEIIYENYLPIQAILNEFKSHERKRWKEAIGKKIGAFKVAGANESEGTIVLESEEPKSVSQ